MERSDSLLIGSTLSTGHRQGVPTKTPHNAISQPLTDVMPLTADAYKQTDESGTQYLTLTKATSNRETIIVNTAHVVRFKDCGDKTAVWMTDTERLPLYVMESISYIGDMLGA